MRTGFSFNVDTSNSGARLGELNTPHGKVNTPAFMPVATQATVKTLTPEEVSHSGAEMILSNAYHLYLRPGVETVRKLGGLHQFMKWNGPILTDSGGFQAFSMGSLGKADEVGIRFRSHVDGSEHRFTPEVAIKNQEGLGADIIMCLDQCIAYGETREAVVAAMNRTHRWALISRQTHDESQEPYQQALFGIVQGGIYPDLRTESVAALSEIPFDGFAIGGLAVGESKSQMYEIVDLVSNLLPVGKPRYLMGVGSPEDLVESVARGVDMFDCVLPTRVARNGALFTKYGRINVGNRRFAQQAEPIEEDCDCYCCVNYSAAYVWHLFKAKEILGLRLATVHNLRFLQKLMSGIRISIEQNQFSGFRNKFWEQYIPTDEATRQAQKQKWLIARGS
ncbi:MAG: tRNA guanosine(34) transglycosylase Tgt [Chloroflexi bacterium]|nr:tRNA guanosine(34) transglycosylase Tgt [Chloroflexota bacterium]|tara:strand:- start:1249 stop:2427 length:1179 start_codon:yes stop_codon:yes gene_type:complete